VREKSLRDLPFSFFFHRDKEDTYKIRATALEMQYENNQHAADLKREPSEHGDAAPSYAVATQAGVRKAEGEPGSRQR
jgi:hypothetical protein